MNVTKYILHFAQVHIQPAMILMFLKVGLYWNGRVARIPMTQNGFRLHFTGFCKNLTNYNCMQPKEILSARPISRSRKKDISLSGFPKWFGFIEIAYLNIAKTIPPSNNVNRIILDMDEEKKKMLQQVFNNINVIFLLTFILVVTGSGCHCCCLVIFTITSVIVHSHL